MMPFERFFSATKPDAVEKVESRSTSADGRKSGSTFRKSFCCDPIAD